MIDRGLFVAGAARRRSETATEDPRLLSGAPVVLAIIVLVYIYRCIVHAMRETPRAQDLAGKIASRVARKQSLSLVS